MSAGREAPLLMSPPVDLIPLLSIRYVANGGSGIARGRMSVHRPMIVSCGKGAYLGLDASRIRLGGFRHFDSVFGCMIGNLMLTSVKMRMDGSIGQLWIHPRPL